MKEVWCCRQNDALKDAHILIPGICKCVVFGKRHLADVIEVRHFEMERFSWIVWVGTIYSQGSLGVEGETRKRKL